MAKGSGHGKMERLQKYLARSGVASRRGAEEIIVSGRVTVNGEMVDKLPVFVDPARDEVTVDGERVGGRNTAYVALNKPAGYVCTASHGEGRRAQDLIPEKFGRVFSAGRLDAESEGLIIFTNDGAFADVLTHPRFGLHKTYEVTVRDEADEALVRRLEKGVHLSDGRMSCEKVRVVKRFRGGAVLKITLAEGRNRQIRRMLAKLGLKVKKLRRISIGHIKLGRLRSGRTRLLSKAEIDAVRKLAR